MALIGINTALHAVLFDDILSVNCYSSVPGKSLRNRASLVPGSNSEVVGISLCSLAALSSSCNSHPLDTPALTNGAAVDGQRILDLDLKSMTDEREEVKTMLVEFLQARGVNGSLAVRAVNKSTRLTSHLLSLLRMVFRMRYLAGKAVTASEVRKSLSPFLETLGAQHEKGLVEVFMCFPDAPTMKPREESLYYFGDSFTSPILGEVKFGNFPQLQAHMVHGKLPLSVVYLLELGFPPPEVADVVSRFPAIASYSVEGKVKPIIELLLGMGVLATDVPKIILRRPQLFGCSLEENIKPTVALLEGLGVDSEGWIKILSQFPHLLTYSFGKVQQVVQFLADIGLSPKESGKVLVRFPQMIGYSVKAKLKPFADYFNSIGIVDLKNLVVRSPQALGLSLELNIKPTILFFSDNGYTMEELSITILRFPQLLGLSTQGNIRPKWEFFVEMGRANSELVDFPQYFGYSLEKRIKPRFRALEMRGVSWSLNRMLSMTDVLFFKHLEKEKELSGFVENLRIRDSDDCH